MWGRSAAALLLCVFQFAADQNFTVDKNLILHVGLCGSVWVCVGLCGSVCVCVCLCGSVSVYVDLCGSVSVCVSLRLFV